MNSPQNPVCARSMSPNSLAFTIFLGLLAALPAVSIDISSPTLILLPGLLRTSELVAGLTLSLFMLGFAAGQLAGGMASDDFGRRPILLAGLATYSVATIACAIAATGSAMVAARSVQGIGAGICAVISFAIVQDLYRGAAARAKRAYVTVVVGVAPMMAPAVGSLVIEIAGWRAVHLTMVVAGVLLLAVVQMRLAESLSLSQRAARRAAPRRDPLWRDSGFVTLTLANALSYGGAFAYIAGSPVVVMGYYRASPGTYSAIFACIAVALSAGAWTSGRLSRRGVSAEKTLSVALAASTVSALAGLCVSCTIDRSVSGPVNMSLLAIVIYCRGVISPCFQHLAIERQPDRAGTASAAYGVAQLLGGAFSSAVVAAYLARPGPLAVTIPMAFCATGAFALWRWTTRTGVARSGPDMGATLRPISE